MTNRERRKQFCERTRKQLEGCERVKVTGYHTGDFIGSVIDAGHTSATLRVVKPLSGDLTEGETVLVIYGHYVKFEEVAAQLESV